MRILVVAASRHGSTAEIASAIGTRLRHHGHAVDVLPPTAVSAPEAYDAVVIGSAVYVGSWLKDARAFVETHAGALARTHVWLFSSGPLDDPEGEALPAERVDQLTSATAARGHHVFAGRLDRSRLHRTERLVAKVVHAPDGDFRDWAEVALWADEIAAALAEVPAGGGSRSPLA